MASDIKVDRSPRENATREKTARPTSWKPASAIPEVTDRIGYRHRWIRKSMYGQLDPTNLSKKRREGWEPCRLEDYPEIEEFIDPDAKNSGLIEIGGLVLHRLSSERAKARAEYYANRNQQELKSAEAMYSAQAGVNPAMPIFKDNKSNTKFGSGE
jgi:hypothetical protein